ncbi:hypothetical protein BU25DRAFT_411234, partial [Macroventuria anomochaeta]
MERKRTQSSSTQDSSTAGTSRPVSPSFTLTNAPQNPTTPPDTPPQPHRPQGPPASLLSCSPTSTQPFSLSSVTCAITYPVLPSMPSRDLAPFHKGAQIALENIFDDYLRNTGMSLL